MEVAEMCHRLGSGIVAAALILSGCSLGPPAAVPHDMTGREHARAAADEEAEAASHDAQYVRDAANRRERGAISDPHCGGPAEGDLLTPGICWTSIMNPTAHHLAEAAEHRRVAAQHRTAAAALVVAEEQACAGVAPVDRDASPFSHRDDIESVRPLRAGNTLHGATIVFGPVPGMTRDQVERVVTCHLERNAAMASDDPGMADCPLAVPRIHAQVVALGERIAVLIESDDPAGAAEILLRAARSLPRRDQQP